MSDTVKLILSLSLSGSLLVVLLLAVKPFMKNRVPKTFQYYLWLIVLLRLILPISFETGLTNNAFHIAETVWRTVLDSHDGTKAAVPESGKAAVQSNTPVTQQASGSLLSVGSRLKAGYYNNDMDHFRYINDLISQTVLLIWAIGVFTALAFHISGYLAFTKRLKRANKTVSAKEDELLRTQLADLQLRKPGLKLFRNRFVMTPMLLGLFKPCIVIPDMEFTKEQLKGILLHELTHLRYQDIAVKWFAVLVTSLHWFNPLMILVKREMNRACELSCDERVIGRLGTDARQVYGETLISVVAERKYPVGLLSTTMCEEKKTLKERLIAIMQYGGRSGRAAALSVVLLVVFICAASLLGVFVIRSGSQPDANNSGKGYGSAAADDTGKITGAKTGELLSSGNYNLSETVKHRTAYVGNNSKDLALVASLPAPDTFFAQRYISLETKERPYGLTAYYEAAKDAEYPGEWPVSTSGSKLEVNSKLNALVLFAMIDNVDEITFAFRDTQPPDGLDQDSYDTVYSFSRKEIESEYGALKKLADTPEQLSKVIDQAALKWSKHISAPETAEQRESKIDKLMTAIMSSPKASSNPGDYFREHRTEYDEIVSMGKDALPYLKNLAADHGLRGVIADNLISDIQGSH